MKFRDQYIMQLQLHFSYNNYFATPRATNSQLLNHYFASVGFAASAEHRDILSPTDSHLGVHTATLWAVVGGAIVDVAGKQIKS